MRRIFFKNIYFRRLFPLLICDLFVLFTGSADQIMAGKMIGENAVAAVGLVLPFSNMIFFLGSLISIGAAICYMEEYGKFRLEDAYGVAGQTLLSNIVLGILSGVLMYVAAPRYLAGSAASAEIREMAARYFRVLSVLAFFYPAYSTFYDFVMNDGDPGLCLMSDLVQFLTNVIVSVSLMRKIGIEGLAFGTLASYIAGSTVIAAHFFRKSNSIKFRFSWKPDVLLRSVKLGAYFSLESLVTSVGGFLINACILKKYGSSYLPAYSVMLFITGSCSVFVSFFSAGSALISVSYGEENPKSIRRIFRHMMKSACIGAVIATILVHFAAPLLPKMYDINTPGVYDAAVSAARMASLCYLFSAILGVLVGYYSLIGHSLLSFILNVAGKLLLVIPLQILFSELLGFIGLSAGIAATGPLILIFTAGYLLRKYGKKQFPLLLEESSRIIFMEDIVIDGDLSMDFRDRITDGLLENGVSRSTAYKAALCMEETIVNIQEKNPGKRVLCELSVLWHKESGTIRIIEKDNGTIHNALDENSQTRSLNGYVVSLMMGKIRDKSYAVTTGFNRSSISLNDGQGTNR